MGRIEQGKLTRDRLADALLALLKDRNLSSIRVQEVAEAAGVDRQTVYRHFSDIYALAEFAYDREIVRLFGVSSIDETFELVDPHIKSIGILQSLGDASKSLRQLLAFFHARNPRGHFYELMRRRAVESYAPTLREAGYPEKAIQTYENVWATSATAIVLSWLQGDIDLTAEELDGTLSHTAQVVCTDLARQKIR